MSYPLAMTDVHAGYGKTEVLCGASLQLQAGSITGLLGRNGAGKTTLMRAAIGLIKARQGKAELFGTAAWDSPPAIRERLGYVSQNLEHFPADTVDACLELIGSFYSGWDSEFIKALRQRWGVRSSSISDLSVGQKQKVALLLALGHRPELLILDEPVASLDPAARRDFLSTLVELNNDSNQSILLSSHITSDIERMCSHVAILHQGCVLCHEALDDLKEQLTIVNQPEPPIEGRVLLSNGQQHWVMQSPHANNGAVSHQPPTVLEDLFLELTQ